MPPAVTADSTAAEVQLAAVPVPIVWAVLTSSSPMPAGTVAVPAGLPGLKLVGEGVGVAVALNFTAAPPEALTSVT
jgi:hypothetical protein